MSVSENQLEKLKQRIFKAFEDVPYPKSTIAPHECDECRDVRKTFAGKNWKTIPAAILEENYGIIPLFSPEAFNYFLPAYLIHSLGNFGEKYDTTCEFTIYAVSPDNEDIKNRLDYWKQKFADFTTEQMNCIYEFLDFVRIDENFESFVNEVATGRQNLKDFIKPNLEK